jgi:hypothetical protein
MNSEAMLARLRLGGGGAASGSSVSGISPAAAAAAVGASGSSFTSANAPGLRKLANAPLVNKITEYVQVRKWRPEWLL